MSYLYFSVLRSSREELSGGDIVSGGSRGQSPASRRSPQLSHPQFAPPHSQPRGGGGGGGSNPNIGYGSRGTIRYYNHNQRMQY